MDKDEVIAALIDVLDGQSSWHDIRDNTGLSEERCREIKKVYYEALKEYKEVHGI